MPEFHQTWEVILIDSDITEGTVRRWLNAAGVPSCWNFVFETNPSGKILVESLYGQTFPAPLLPYSVSIYRTDNPLYKINNIPGVAFPWKHTCCVAFFPPTSFGGGDSDIEIGARIWHEFLHAQGVDTDTLKTSEQSGFCLYLQSINSPYKDFCSYPDKYDGAVPGHSEILAQFYAYLTQKYFKCECFGEGCVTTTQPPSDLFELPYVTPEDEDRKKAMNNLLLIGGAVVVLVLII